MAKMTEPVAEQLHSTALRTLDDHPLVVPVATAHRQLQDEQRRLTAELVETRKTIFAAESDAPDPLVPPKVLRQARQRATQLEEALDDIHAALFASSETLEAARSEARGELRPGLQQEAAQLLRDVLTQAEQLLEAQQHLLALDARTRRLSTSLPLGGCVDSCLPGRIKVIRQVLVQLED
jgi:DNA repair exonuclease SbcCD ATPase subunit